MFCLKTFLSNTLFLSFINLSALINFFQLYLHVGFQKIVEPMFFRLPTCPFSVSIGFVPHLSWRDQPHFHKVHYANNLFWGWVLIATIITTKDLSNYGPFLLKAISVSSFGPFPFQAHLGLMDEFFSLNIVTCIPLFMQFVERGLNCFQESISNKLHNHFFSSIIFNMVFYSHYALWDLLQT